MDTGLVLIHFGEPSTPDPATVEHYLTRIFLQNAELETRDAGTPRERAEELAARRAPGLIEEYERIDGSPLNAQARDQAAAVARTLADRGYDVSVEVAFQFIEPTIGETLARMKESGIDRLVALPVYPLCGPSTTVAALETVDRRIADMHWNPEISRLSGWHRHPRYLRMRASHIEQYATDNGIDLTSPTTTLLFSAHGTPISYIDEGSRYVQYVEETCEALAALLGIEEYALGYQNHENRDIAWTSPAVGDALATLDVEAVVVEPVSFMHEQSETMVELDDDLATQAADLDLAFFRVPIPHDQAAFPRILADVVEPVLAAADPSVFQLRPCRCAPSDNTYCRNAPIR